MSRTIDIRGKPVTFSSKTLKSGEIAYYRSGKRATTEYQTRVAKGILAGKSLQEARGHPFGAYTEKLLTQKQIDAEEEFHLGQWAEPPKAKGRGKEKHQYYIKVSCTSESSRRVGSPEGTEEACVARTLMLRDPTTNTQTGFTYSDLAKRFEQIALYTIQSYGLTLCTGNLHEDLIAIWRHSRK
jgi:hypothetical protein